MTGVQTCALPIYRTPFYGESGGQVGDKGVVYDPSGSFKVRVIDTIKSANRIVHVGKLATGTFAGAINKGLIAEVEARLRKSTAGNHTATHLLHKALKSVLGDHVNQAGSLVTPERLRFDVTHFEKISDDQLDRVEEIVNEQVRRNHPVTALSRTYDEAKQMGASALFGEKYGDVVRIVKIDDYSMELCGGTHLNATGEIGYFRIVSESSVAAGVRRIEAVTGEAADRLVRTEKNEVNRTKMILGVPETGITQKVKNLLEERKQLLKEASELHIKLSSQNLDALIKNAELIDGFKFVSEKITVESVDEMKKLGDLVRAKLKSGIGVLGSIIDEKPFLLCVVTDDLIKSKNLRAGDIIKQLAKYINGGGGGRPHMAQAGGKDAGKIDVALTKASGAIKDLIA